MKKKFKAWSPQRNDFVTYCFPLGSCKDNVITLTGVGEGDDVVDTEDDGLILIQNTGINDKNDNEIWDGDILYYEARNQWFKVFAVPGGFAVNTHQDDLAKDKIFFYTGLSDMQNYSWAQGLEIKGNIFKNPELLYPKN